MKLKMIIAQEDNKQKLDFPLAMAGRQTILSRLHPMAARS